MEHCKSLIPPYLKIPEIWKTPSLCFASKLVRIVLGFLTGYFLFIDVVRRSMPLLASGALLMVLCSFGCRPVVAQVSVRSTPPTSPVPDAPEPRTPDSSDVVQAQQAGEGTISGTVLDTNQDVVEGATVTLWGRSGAAYGRVESGSDGQFVFTGLPADVYKVTATAPGMSTYSSAPISLAAGEAKIVTAITLSVSGGTTSITVSENNRQLSEEQVHIAVAQRIGGVIPNFYSAYDWNAPPMQAKQKLELGLRSVLDPVSFLSVAAIAGAEQYRNIFPEYGSGLEGYGKRYGAALATHASSTLLGRAVFPSIFHQDPRYFYKGNGSIQSRALYAISAAVVARGDDGRWKPNYSRVLGNFSSAALSNLYYPASERGASLVLLNGLAGTGGDAVANLLREFVLKHITSHVPKGAGKP